MNLCREGFLFLASNHWFWGWLVARIGWPYFQTPKPFMQVLLYALVTHHRHLIRMGDNYFSAWHTYREHNSTLWTPWTQHFGCQVLHEGVSLLELFWKQTFSLAWQLIVSIPTGSVIKSPKRCSPVTHRLVTALTMTLIDWHTWRQISVEFRHMVLCLGFILG